jgi:hypothetical protein
MSADSLTLKQHVSQPITLDEQAQKLKQVLLRDIQRSAYVYRVDCGDVTAVKLRSSPRSPAVRCRTLRH